MPEIENWKMGIEEAKITLEKYETQLRVIAEREVAARDGLEILGTDRGTTAAYSRRIFQTALEEVAEDREKLEDGVARMKKKIAVLQGYLREAAAGVKAEERQRRVDVLLRKVGDVRSIV